MKTMTTFSNNLLLLSVLLLLCGRVVGERGESPQRRRTAVGDRDTIAPASSDSSDIGEGMKFEKSIKSFSGKGMKSDKSEKSLKSEKKYGKGFDMVLSMDMELPEKGAKKDKDIKMVKSRKSEKSEKNEKIEKRLKQEKSGVTFPSTPSPTSVDSISSKSSTFAITYSPTKEIPTSKNLQELTMMTQKYLEDFMMSFFDKTALTDLDNFLTIMVRDVFVAGEPVLAEFQSNGLFNPDSIFIPVTRELDNLIQDAIAQDEYLLMLKDLSKSNPFRETETIAFTEGDTNTTAGDSTDSNRSESSSFVRAGVAAAAAGVVILAAGLAMLKSRRPSQDDDNNDTQSFSPRKSSSEDLTIAGDTCTMSVEDASSHFAHWRTAKSYNNGSEGGEFKDEPLDS